MESGNEFYDAFAANELRATRAELCRELGEILFEETKCDDALYCRHAELYLAIAHIDKLLSDTSSPRK